MEQKKYIHSEPYTKELAKWIDTFEVLTQNEKVIAFQMFYNKEANNLSLYHLYNQLKDGVKEYKNADCDIAYRVVHNDCEFYSAEKSFTIAKSLALLMISVILELSDEVLPLGSVVRLKYTFIQNDKEQPLFVIIHRYILQPQSSCYYTYAGVPYPIGEMADNKIMHFTVPAIDQLVFRGYEDTTDKAFIMFMKNKLILDNKKHSACFSDLYR